MVEIGKLRSMDVSWYMILCRTGDKNPKIQGTPPSSSSPKKPSLPWIFGQTKSHLILEAYIVWCREHAFGEFTAGEVDGWFRADSCHQKSDRFWWIQHWTVITDPCVFVKEDIWDISLQIHLFPSSPSLVIRHRAREWVSRFEMERPRDEKKKRWFPKKYSYYKYHTVVFMLILYCMAHSDQ